MLLKKKIILNSMIKKNENLKDFKRNQLNTA